MLNKKIELQTGFTLVELIIVIVIIGILAVSAAPKFIDISKDANANSVKALKAALVSTNQIVYAKAVIQGIEKEASANITLANGDLIPITYGYLSYDDDNRSTGAESIERALDFSVCHHLGDADDCKNDDWLFDIDDGHVQFYNVSMGLDPTNNRGNGSEPLCYLQYTLAVDENTPPSYELQLSEC